MNGNSKDLVLVTGACGFIGSHMVDFLISEGYRVRATDLGTADKKYLNKSGNVEFIPADITRKETLIPLLRGVKKIFHPAAIFDFGASWDLLYKVNVGGTKNLCEAALNSDVEHIIVWSSGVVYGKSGNILAKESMPFKGTGNYERSKALQEEMAMKFYKEKGLPVTILRPAAVYGPRSKYGIALIVQMMAKRLLFMIPGKKEIRGALVHARDVVGAAEYLSRKEEAIGEAYNINDDLSSVYAKEELLLCAAEALNRKIFAVSIPLWLIYPLAEASEIWAKMTKTKPAIAKGFLKYLAADYTMDNSKIKSLGYQLVYPDTKIGLRETIKWYQKEGWV